MIKKNSNILAAEGVKWDVYKISPRLVIPRRSSLGPSYFILYDNNCDQDDYYDGEDDNDCGWSMIIDHVLHHLPLLPPPPGHPPLASDALLGPGHKKFDQTVAKKHKAVSTKYNLDVAKNPPPTFPSSSRTIWSNGGFCTTSNYLNRYLMLWLSPWIWWGWWWCLWCRIIILIVIMIIVIMIVMIIMMIMTMVEIMMMIMMTL